MTHTITATKAALTAAAPTIDEIIEVVEAFQCAKPVFDAVHEVIGVHGDEGIPSGKLYVHVMGYMSLETYHAMIDIMVKAGKITLENHILRAK